MIKQPEGYDNEYTDAWQSIYQAADYYSQACGMICRVVDAFGKTLHLAAPNQQTREFCEQVAAILPGRSPNGERSCSQICENAHLYGCYQAERFGGQYIYFCPLGLTHWASPVMAEGHVVGALLGGPVLMVDPDDFLIDELVTRNGINPACLPELRQLMEEVPIIETERVNALSETLFLVASAVSDKSYEDLQEKRKSGDLQAKIWDHIRFMKAYTHQDNEQMTYPLEKEARLLDLIEMGDKAGSQQVLNEIMGHIFFSSSGSIEVMQARVIELVVLLSRAAIRGGADVEQIFGLNYTYLNKISQFRSIDEIAYWLSAIMARFTDQVFNLTHVKHADVIYRAVNYIRNNYTKKITLEETAEHVFLSPAYFSRIFKEEIGENFNVYVNRIRVEAAKKLLLKEQVALVDISTQVGFEGQSYFSKVFKRMTGTTPGKYRESRGKTKPLIKS